MQGTTGTINTTGTGAAISYTFQAGPIANEFAVGVSGTYGGFSNKIQGQLATSGDWFDLSADNLTTRAAQTSGTVSPGDNTSTLYVGSCKGCIAIRVYATARTSGTQNVAINVGNFGFGASAAPTGYVTQAVSTFAADVTVTDANLVLGTSTGTKIGTATSQKLAFYNSTPITQQAGTTELVTVLTALGLTAAGAHPLTLNGLLTLTDVNVALGTSTGTQIGTASSQKLGFYGLTAITQPAGNGTQATAAAGGTTTCFLNTTLTGGSGSTAYTVGDVVKCLKQLGLIQT
jgi:hypothetical protein